MFVVEEERRFWAKKREVLVELRDFYLSGVEEKLGLRKRAAEVKLIQLWWWLLCQ